MANPYCARSNQASEVMNNLISKMCGVEDMKLFRNVLAVYVIWQDEKHKIENAVLEWEINHG